MRLDSPISQITNFGTKLAPKLKKLGLETAYDLLYYFPYRWDDLRTVSAIKDLRAGELFTTRGKITFIESRRSWKRRMIITSALIDDTTGTVSVIWFNQPYISKNLKSGDEVFLSGKVDNSETGFLFKSPEYEKITRASKNNPTHSARIVPRYSLSGTVSQKQFRFLIKRALPLARKVTEWMPRTHLEDYNLLTLPQSLELIHFPTDPNALGKAQDRLKFDELFLIQLSALTQKSRVRAFTSIQIPFLEKETRSFVKSLPFTLTDAQKKSSWEVLKNLEKNYSMNRLLEGDVGSGKTIVVAIAILNVVLNKHQVAYMAPTEILARQIYEKMCELLTPQGATVALLTRTECRVVVDRSHKKTDEKQFTKRELLKMIREGNIDLVVGTHALIQKSVSFFSLALTIIDEQHRFGVSQRRELARGSDQIRPHLLSMSATPIPRSLALTVYGDLDLSVIDELPKGRKPIKTTIVSPEKRPDTYRFIHAQIKEGKQAYVICPLIDPSDKLGVKSVTDEFKKLNEKIFPDLEIGLLHGRLAAAKKDALMNDFYNNKIHILVSTTVVEVGVDVPNATIMMIEGAERFGLAQMHQLRGRVGRSTHESYCFLFTESTNNNTVSRLHTLMQAQNGFELAEADLEFRGPGEVYGVRQAGFLDRLKIAKLTDYPVIKKAREAASNILKSDPTLEHFPELQKRLSEWEQDIHLE